MLHINIWELLEKQREQSEDKAGPLQTAQESTIWKPAGRARPFVIGLSIVKGSSLYRGFTCSCSKDFTLVFSDSSAALLMVSGASERSRQQDHFSQVEMPIGSRHSLSQAGECEVSSKTRQLGLPSV